MKTLLLTALAAMCSFWGYSQITINEVDSNTPGDDTAEFVELYAASETSLDGHVLVFFNGGGDNAVSYRTIDLTGQTITDGYFVAGNAATPNVDVTFDNNGLQNGEDAVALYMAAAADWADESAFSTTGLVDLVVYDSNDDDILELLSAFAVECQVQINESENGEGDVQSISRVPDGGTAMCPTDFVVQMPSPGSSNVPLCTAGTVSLTDESTELTLCIDDDAIELINYSATGAMGETVIFVITDNEDIIIATTNGEEIDSSTLSEGICRIHSVAYNGVIDTETTVAGEDLSAIATDGDCISFSSNYITITRNICSPPCDGGTVMSDAGNNAIVCLDEEMDVISFLNETLATEASYQYVLTDESNLLVGLVAEGSSDFNILDEGTYRVWGMSYMGDIDTSTLDEGDALFSISSSECIDFSENYITVTAQSCEDVEGCGNIFFSEYQEGSGSNKLLEIYNPTQFPVSLSDYQLVNCSNGCDVEGEWDFTNDIFEGGVIAPGDVFVVAHPDAVQALLDEADVTFQYLSNGDDVFALQRISTSEIIDIIGEASTVDIDGGWTVNGVENGTQNHTLVRMETVNEGTTDWALGQDQWMVNDEDDHSFVGSHTIIPCTVSDVPSVSFTAEMSSVEEDAEMATVEITVLNPLAEDMTVEVMLTGGTAVTPDDFDGTTFPMTITFPGGMDTPQTFTVSIVDDMMEEGAETITLELMNPSAGLEVEGAMHTLTINPSDVLIPVLAIGDAAEIDADGVAVNLDLECEIRGVVYGVNMNGGGVQFTLIDATGGIGVYGFEAVSGYTVVEGDSVHVVGEIGQFNGLTQTAVTSIELISSDNDLIDATVVTELNEFSESNLITLECVELVDPSQWTGDGSFNVDVTDGINTYAVRVDSDTDVSVMTAPDGVFTLTGIGGQYDSETPFDSGYQILPRYMADVSAGVSAAFSLNEGNSTGITVLTDDEYVAGSGSVANFEGDNGDLDYTWTINGNETTGSSVDVTVEDSWNGIAQELVVSATDGACTASSTAQVTFTWLGIEEFENVELLVYPNPTSDQLTLDLPNNGIIRIVNSLGQVVKTAARINAGTNQINVSDLEIGTYYIEVISETAVYNAQFIKK